MADRLATWCLAAFNVAVLAVVGVLTLHASVDLGDLLAGLDTLTGFVLYAALWALTLWTNGRALAGVSPDGDRPAPRTLLLRAVRWGATTGACFLWVLLAVVFLPDTRISPIIREGGELAVILLIATLFAALVGALLGVVVGSIDLVVLRAVRAARSDSRTA